MIVKLETIRNGVEIITASKKSSGYDLQAVGYRRVKEGKLEEEVIFDSNNKSVILSPFEKILILTGLKVDLSEGYEEYDNEDTYIVDAQVLPRSGVSLKTPLLAIIGSIDNDYNGELGVIIQNISNETTVINSFERIAQIRFTVCLKNNNIAKILTTDRNEKGFGHTGK